MYSRNCGGKAEIWRVGLMGFDGSHKIYYIIYIISYCSVKVCCRPKSLFGVRKQNLTLDGFSRNLDNWIYGDIIQKIPKRESAKKAKRENAKKATLSFFRNKDDALLEYGINKKPMIWDYYGAFNGLGNKVCCNFTLGLMLK